ncbi:hypothetical protein LHU53_12085 [Rhodoferax sp. U2-2l]|uniref:hypothetical protein n=1 Tax=Rhodoferax sp. U2-2l TaxID=2884000 RepID=UPI001D09EB8B|nr:hypothetical protein [Rhodoferax sp. U2-2l]MCB8747644.1 hypothetical protein [Rhodoferax sp. U2-2l]
MGSTLDDDDDERHQFTVVQKKAAKHGYALARTTAGYRLDAPGVVAHRMALDGVLQLLSDCPPWPRTARSIIAA